MSKPAGLIRKKSAYFYVRRIPEALKPMFGGKTQLTIPLQTSDPRVAANRARAKAAEVDRQFENARLGISPPEAAAGGAATIAQLESAVRVHLFEMERVEDRAPPTSDDYRHAAELLGFLKDDEEAWEGSIHTTAISIASKYRLKIAPGDRLWLEFTTLVHRAETEHARRSLDRAKKVYGVSTHDVLFEDVHARKTAPKLVNSNGVTVEEVIRRFEADPIRAGLTVSAAKKYIIPFLALREVAGSVATVREITRGQCAEMMELIAGLPANYTKFREFDNKSLAQIVELNRKLGKKSLSPGTVQVYAHHLSAFFNYAIQKGLCETNPATRLVPQGAKRVGGRIPFETSEINRLLAALPKWADFRQGGRYWLPLIALFSGMRLGEIIWLKRCDIRKVDGVDVFHLERQEDRSLKTEGAQRAIPIHPVLVELGFMTYIERFEHSDRIFGDLPGEDQKQAVDLFQKRFSYWLGKHIKVRKGVSFHSWRHSFRDATRNAGIPTDIVRALGGWARGSSIEERYGQGARPSVIAEWLANVAYPDIDYSHLKAKMNPGAKIAALPR